MADIRDIRAKVLAAAQRPAADDFDRLATGSLVMAFNHMAGDAALTAHVRATPARTQEAAASAAAEGVEA